MPLGRFLQVSEGNSDTTSSQKVPGDEVTILKRAEGSAASLVSVRAKRFQSGVKPEILPAAYAFPAALSRRASKSPLKPGLDRAKNDSLYASPFLIPTPHQPSLITANPPPSPAAKTSTRRDVLLAGFNGRSVSRLIRPCAEPVVRSDHPPVVRSSNVRLDRKS